MRCSGHFYFGDLTDDVELTFEGPLPDELTVQVETVKITAEVTEMVLRHWTEVVCELRDMGIGKKRVMSWFDLGG